MAERAAGRLLGRALFWRWRGEVWVNMLRPWLLPVFAGAGVSKYLGLSVGEAVAVAVAIPLVVESLAVVAGRIEQRIGAIRSQYQLALEQDPYRSESVRLLRAIEAHLDAIERRLVSLDMDLPDRAAIMERIRRVVKEDKHG